MIFQYQLMYRLILCEMWHYTQNINLDKPQSNKIFYFLCTYCETHMCLAFFLSHGLLEYKTCESTSNTPFILSDLS